MSSDTEHEDGFTSTDELAECVRINWDNMKRMMPTLSMHPLLPMFEAQLTALLDRVGWPKGESDA